VATLRLAERGVRDQATRLGRIVVLDRRLEVLALRRGLTKLPPEPAEEAHGSLICHAEQASVVVGVRPRRSRRTARRPPSRPPLPRRRGCTPSACSRGRPSSRPRRPRRRAPRARSIAFPSAAAPPLVAAPAAWAVGHRRRRLAGSGTPSWAGSRGRML